SENRELAELIVQEAKKTSGVELPLRLEERRRLASEAAKIDQEIKNLIAVIAQEGPASPMRKYVSDRLTELEPRKQEIAERIERLAIEIENLEKKRIDVDVMRNCLQNFIKLFTKLKPEEQADLVQLLVDKVVYDKKASKIQIALRPLPEVWGDLEVLESLFSQCLKTLPDM